MCDYSNMPVLDWSGEYAPIKAKTQIMHEEPVILQMPNTFDVSVNTPPAKAGGFGLRLKAGSIGHSAD